MEPLVRSDEWNSLKEQFALLVRAGGARTDEFEELLDVQFQRRVAELIAQAAGLITAIACVDLPLGVRFWHKADIPSCTAHVRFRG